MLATDGREEHSPALSVSAAQDCQRGEKRLSETIPVGQGSRLMCMVRHLGFVSQADGGETKAATQNGFYVTV